MKRRELIKVARQEMREWKTSIPRGVVMAILFAFIHRVTTGETVEETFFTVEPETQEIDYSI